MKIRILTLMLVTLAVGFGDGIFESAHAQSRFGVRGGAYMDQEDAFVGIQAKVTFFDDDALVLGGGITF